MPNIYHSSCCRAALLLAPIAHEPASAETCLPPARPFVPSDRGAASAYADLIRQDFETCLTAIQTHLQCLERERARAFTEAQEVSQEYGRSSEMTRE